MIDSSLRARVQNDILWQEIVELSEAFEVEPLERQQGSYGVVLRSFPLPATYRLAPAPGQGPENVREGMVDLLLRIPENYPHAPPDMFWVRPFVLLPGGGYPGAADQFEDWFGLKWQRFSWHMVHRNWRPVADTLLNTFVPFVERRLHQGS